MFARLTSDPSSNLEAKSNVTLDLDNQTPREIVTTAPAIVRQRTLTARKAESKPANKLLSPLVDLLNERIENEFEMYEEKIRQFQRIQRGDYEEQQLLEQKNVMREMYHWFMIEVCRLNSDMQQKPKVLEPKLDFCCMSEFMRHTSIMNQ